MMATRKTITLKNGTRRPVFKVLDGEGNSTVQGHPWSRPSGKRPGKWMEVDRDITLVMCNHGLHLTIHPFRWAGWGSEIFLAEYEVPKDLPRQSDKICVYRARLIREVSRAEVRQMIQRATKANNRRRLQKYLRTAK
jgi:hypothetical protein